MTDQPTAIRDDLFDSGPPRGLQTALRLVKPDNRKAILRAVVAALIAWAPLVLLAAAQSLALGPDKLTNLLFDFAVHTRYLIAVPLFILAQPFTLSTLGRTARNFVEAELIRDQDRPRFKLIAADILRSICRILSLLSSLSCYRSCLSCFTRSRST